MFLFINYSCEYAFCLSIKVFKCLADIGTSPTCPNKTDKLTTMTSNPWATVTYNVTSKRISFPVTYLTTRDISTKISKQLTTRAATNVRLSTVTLLTTSRLVPIATTTRPVTMTVKDQPQVKLTRPVSSQQSTLKPKKTDSGVSTTSTNLRRFGTVTITTPKKSITTATKSFTVSKSIVSSTSKTVVKQTNYGNWQKNNKGSFSSAATSAVTSSSETTRYPLQSTRYTAVIRIQTGKADDLSEYGWPTDASENIKVVANAHTGESSSVKNNFSTIGILFGVILTVIGLLTIVGFTAWFLRRKRRYSADREPMINLMKM